MSEFTEWLRNCDEPSHDAIEKAADLIDELEQVLMKLEGDYFERKVVMGNRVDIAEREAFESARNTLAKLWNL